MVRRNGSWWRRQDAARTFDEVVGAAAASQHGKLTGWDTDALRHDVQVMAEADALRYCAVEVVHEEKVVAIWVPYLDGGEVRTIWLASRPPTDYATRFVVYLRKDLGPYRDRLIFPWEPWLCRPVRRTAGWVEIMPSRTALGKIGLSDGRCAALLPRDARGLEQGDHVECVVRSGVGTDALTAFLVSKAATTSGTTVPGWIPRPRTGESPARVVVGGEALLHRSSAEGCPACREQARGRLRRSVTAVLRTLPAKIAVGLITALIVSALSSLAVVLVK